MAGDNLDEIGKGALSAIRCMVDALECDYDRLEELKDERSEWVSNDGGDDDEQERTVADWANEFPDEAAELAELEADAGDCSDADDARQRIEEDPLSIEYRSDWQDNKDELVASEVCILLTTGGPAVRIIADLEDGTISSPRLEVQDWGTPWTHYYEEGVADVLQAYCEVFCWD